MFLTPMSRAPINPLSWPSELSCTCDIAPLVLAQNAARLSLERLRRHWRRQLLHAIPNASSYVEQLPLFAEVFSPLILRELEEKVAECARAAKVEDAHGK